MKTSVSRITSLLLLIAVISCALESPSSESSFSEFDGSTLSSSSSSGELATENILEVALVGACNILVRLLSPFLFYLTDMNEEDDMSSDEAELSMFDSLPEEILQQIIYFTDLKGTMSLKSSCRRFSKLFEFSYLISSKGHLYHNWIDRPHNQARLSVCHDNLDSKVEEFVLVSRNNFVSEIHSSLQYFILALQSGFVPRRSQKISITASKNLDLLDNSFLETEDFFQLMQHMSRNSTLVHLEIGSVWFFVRLNALSNFLDSLRDGNGNLFLMNLTLQLDFCPEEMLDEDSDIPILFNNTYIRKLRIIISSGAFVYGERLKTFLSVINLTDLELIDEDNLRLRFSHSSFTERDDLLKVLDNMPNLVRFESNAYLPNYKPFDWFRLETDVFLRKYPEFKFYANWSSIDRSYVFPGNLSINRVRNAFKTLAKRGFCHSLKIQCLSICDVKVRESIIDLFRNHSQNVFIQNLSCNLEDFNAHFYRLNVRVLHLKNDKQKPALISQLNKETVGVSCNGFVPKFSRMFFNLEFVHLKDLNHDLRVDVEAFINSYQPLKSLYIHFEYMTNWSFTDLTDKLRNAYANSQKSICRLEIRGNED